MGQMSRCYAVESRRSWRARADSAHLEAADLEAELIAQLLLERLHLLAVVVSLALELDQVRLACGRLLERELVDAL